jgi:hypothetical protein
MTMGPRQLALKDELRWFHLHWDSIGVPQPRTPRRRSASVTVEPVDGQLTVTGTQKVGVQGVEPVREHSSARKYGREPLGDFKSAGRLSTQQKPGGSS